MLCNGKVLHRIIKTNNVRTLITKWAHNLEGSFSKTSSEFVWREGLQFSVNLQKVDGIKKGQFPDGISLWPSEVPHPGWILLYVCTYFWSGDTYQCYADSLHLPVLSCNGTKGKTPVLVPSEFKISFGEVQKKGRYEDWSPCSIPQKSLLQHAIFLLCAQIRTNSTVMDKRLWATPVLFNYLLAWTWHQNQSFYHRHNIL